VLADIGPGTSLLPDRINDVSDSEPLSKRTRRSKMDTGIRMGIAHIIIVRRLHHRPPSSALPSLAHREGGVGPLLTLDHDKWTVSII
jgi:hypothetical protein